MWVWRGDFEKKKNNKRARVCVYVGGCELMLAAACSAIQVCGNCNCSEILWKETQ